MSSFYDDASLVVIPSGYKTSKVYAEKPTDGSGDLTFTRTGDTATRVNSAGLIEKVRTNLALRSQSFATSAVWSTSQGTITNNAGTAPDGTSTASKIVATNSDPYVYQPLTLTGSVAVSCYVKGVGSSIGKVARIIVGASTTDVTMDGTWQRISVTHTAAGAESYGLEIPQPAATSDEVLMWGFQVEYGDVPTDYIATTTAAVSVGPVANVPRLDYLNSSCPRLLLEPQRTNLVTYSEQFNNAAWSKNQSTISSNSATSPDGNMSADKLVEDSSNAYHDINQLPFSTTGGQTYTFSIFVKTDTRSKIRIGYGALVNFDAFGGDVFAIIDVSNKSVISSVLSPTILFSDFENGYVRVTFLKQATGSGQFNLIFGLVNNSNAASYLGDGSSGLFIWGAQMEAGAYATSLIPTLAASVTRGVDLAQKTSASALIGQTEGTIFWEFEFTTSVATNNECLLNVDNGSFNNTIYFYKTPAGAIAAEMYNGGVVQASFSISSQPAGTYKAAFGYANNNTAFFVNGVQVGTTDTSCSVPATSRIQLGNTALGPSTDKTAQVLLFPTRLTNAELAQLTTL